jgi:hypothetical protein
MTRKKNQRRSPAPVANPGIFWVAAHGLKINGQNGRTRQNNPVADKLRIELKWGKPSSNEQPSR